MKTTQYVVWTLGVCCLLAVAAGVTIAPAQDGPPKKDNASDPPRPLPPMGILRDVGISADGKLAYAGDSNRTIWVWDVAKRKLVRAIADPFTSHDTAPCYSFSADGKFAVVGNQTGTQRQGWGIREPDHERLTFWDLSSGVKLRALEMKGESVYAVALSPDGTRALSASVWKVVPREPPTDQDWRNFVHLCALRLWDTSNGKLLQTLSLTGDFGPLAFSSDGEFFVSAFSGPVPPFDEKQTWFLRRWSTARFEDVGAKSMAAQFRRTDFGCIAVSPDGKHLAAGNSAGLSLWNLATGKLSWYHCTHITRDGARFDDWPVTSVAFSEDSKRVIAAGGGDGFFDGRGCSRGGMVVIDTATAKHAPDFVGAKEWVNSVSLAPGGKMLLGATLDGLRFWDAQTGKAMFTLKDRPAPR